MNIVDAVIFVLLIVGAIDGMRKGVINSVVEFVGSILVIVLSWILKNNFANILIKTYPVIGKNAAISAIMYNVIAFVLLLIGLSILLFIILKITDFIESLLKATVILGIFSKILGALFGILKTYLIILVAIIILAGFNFAFIRKSTVSNFMIDNTPVVSKVAKNTYDSIKKVYDESNVLENIQYLFEHNIITEENLNKLTEFYNTNE